MQNIELSTETKIAIIEPYVDPGVKIVRQFLEKWPSKIVEEWKDDIIFGGLGLTSVNQLSAFASIDPDSIYVAKCKGACRKRSGTRKHTFTCMFFRGLKNPFDRGMNRYVMPLNEHSAFYEAKDKMFKRDNNYDTNAGVVISNSNISTISTQFYWEEEFNDEKAFDKLFFLNQPNSRYPELLQRMLSEVKRCKHEGLFCKIIADGIPNPFVHVRRD